MLYKTPHLLRKGVNNAWNNQRLCHQEFQVPKIEVLNVTWLFSRWVSPYISRIHTAYIGEDSSIWMVPDMFGDFECHHGWFYGSIAAMNFHKQKSVAVKTNPSPDPRDRY